jgi:two-component system, NarL family, sensor kinase
MHPRQPELVGKNLVEMRDLRGEPTIRMRLERARTGRGFDAESVRQHPSRGICLRNMRERIEAVGGTLTVSRSRGSHAYLSMASVRRLKAAA